WNPETARRHLKAADYPSVARAAIAEMHRQVGPLCFTGDGVARRGLLLRHLVMPDFTTSDLRRNSSFAARPISSSSGNDDPVGYTSEVPVGGVAEGARIMEWAASALGRDTYVHIMEQYRPDSHVGKPDDGRRPQRLGAGPGKEEAGGNDGGGAARRVRYAEIARPSSTKEIEAVRAAAVRSGLFRLE
ncbi:hypothetical protein HK405_004662, partial [Cladochytrium tenue]